MKVLYDVSLSNEFGRIEEVFVTSYDDETYRKVGFEKTFGMKIKSSHRVTDIRFINPIYDKSGLNVGLGDIREMTKDELIEKGLVIEDSIIEEPEIVEEGQKEEVV